MEVRRYLTLIGIAIMIGIALIASIQRTQTTIMDLKRNNGANEITIWSERLSSIQADLPMEQRWIGYFSESDLPNRLAVRDEDTEYRLSQYVLAPILIEQSLNHAWVLVNFNENAEIQGIAYLKKQGLKQVAAYGNGVYLFYNPQIRDKE